MKLPSFFVAVALFAPAASAQDAEPELDCANAVTQMEMNLCAQVDYEAADDELNRAYRAAMKVMETTDADLGEIDPAYPGAVGALKKAQRAWIPYRDAHCELAGFEARGGSLEPMLVSACLADLTLKRTQELEALAAEGGSPQ
ncbi:MAG TPA: lysozyme inhibitor LprI family protein [Mycoplana sp.]|nr:lysozyme inhibitor LprI family protein [Mycoplana sp.]